MRFLDFSSWQAVITTVLGLVLVTFVMVGIRLLVMESVQQRRQRENRQINERLRTLIAAYKTLGGSFTGDLVVDPTHLRELRQAGPEEAAASSGRQRRTGAPEWGVGGGGAAATGPVAAGVRVRVKAASSAAGWTSAGTAAWPRAGPGRRPSAARQGLHNAP